MAKKIIIFADGTGSAFFKRESNIWRLFDALDTSQNDQIAYYIEGVGTSSFRPWAMFDGATGVGAPENIRKLYRFLCWNWEENDEIYMFGFSRGAFTIRTLIELIKSEGLVPKQFGNAAVSHEEMERNAMAAWRAYRRKSSSWKNIVAIFVRLLRDLGLFIWHGILFHRRYQVSFWSSKKKAAVSDTVTNATVAQERVGDCILIKFVGLFDTVEAFGVPLESLRSAIDKLVWPISFPIEDMSDMVSRVRHALSIDDERTTFHPIRIRRENKYEKSISPVKDFFAKIQSKGAAPQAPTTDLTQDPDRVREVWFAGVHSDVGGGYPDSQLAHIPLVWMLEEIREADRKFAEEKGQDSDGYKLGLRFRPGAEEDFRNASSPYGTLHDSRGGTSVLYRYSPRKIETKGNGTDSTHDVIIHHTVIKRILDGSDNYAPVNLPHDAKVLRADQAIVPLKEYLKIRSTYSRSGPESEYQQKQERLLNLVFRRQACYFLLLLTLLAVASMPVWELLTGAISNSLLASADAWLGAPFGSFVGALKSLLASADAWLGAPFGSLVGALKYVTPSLIGPYLDCVHSYPAAFLILIILMLLFYWRGNVLRDLIRDKAREIWKPSTEILEPINSEIKRKSRGRLFRFRRKLSDSFWNFCRKVTDWLRINRLDLAKSLSGFAVVMGFVFVIFVGSVGFSRIWFNIKLGTGNVCTKTESGLQWVGPDAIWESKTPFTTRNPCWASGIAVEKGIAYRLRIDINPDDPWFDGPIMSDVGGFENDVFLLKLLKSPFLRWPSAGWFQPIARIGNTGDVEWPLVSNDGSGPIPADGAGCKTKRLEQDNGERTLGRMPQSYLDTAEFCEAHSTHCAEERERAKTAMKPSLLDPLGPLPPLSELSKDDLSAARKAWKETNGKWHLNGGSVDCQSSYPRKTLVSDFVAQKTGELFLFVNDAMPLLLRADDTHYQNNSGSANVTLKRAPLFSTTIARVQIER